MKFCNINLSVFNQPEFSAASNKQIGIWLRLYAFCADLENHGIITAAGGWTDIHCKRVLGCCRKDLDKSPLWHIKPSGVLDLYHYNIVAEDFSKKRRKTHRLAVSARSDAKTAAARRNGQKGAEFGHLGGRPKKIISFQKSEPSF